jgi:hypothetical protein
MASNRLTKRIGGGKRVTIHTDESPVNWRLHASKECFGQYKQRNGSDQGAPDQQPPPGDKDMLRGDYTIPSDRSVRTDLPPPAARRLKNQERMIDDK